MNPRARSVNFSISMTWPFRQSPFEAALQVAVRSAGLTRAPAAPQLSSLTRETNKKRALRHRVVAFLFGMIAAAVGEREGRCAAVLRGIAAIAGRLIAVHRMRLIRLLRLVDRHDPPIMFGMLQVVFCGDAIAGGIRIARELQVFLVHMRSRTADLDLRARRIERAIGIDVLRPAAASP